MSDKTAVHDPVLGALTDDRLTRDYRVLQRAKGHRFSSDDMVTALIAWEAVPGARRVADLGCGLGSVLLHLAWKMPDAELVGVEAQAMSFELLRRNVERNALAGRVGIVHGDLRDGGVLDQVAAMGTGGGFALVTGTPPYFPPDTALDAMDEQRAYARVEYRGGVEVYVAAGVRLLAEGGTLVLCGAAGAGDRVERAATQVGLRVQGRCEIVAREGRPALFAVWTLGGGAGATGPRRAVITLRDATGERTPDAEKLRAFSGFAEAGATKGHAP